MKERRQDEKALKLSIPEIAIVKGMLARGDKNQDIAAYFGVNQGRIAEINTGKKGADVDAQHENLPPPGPGISGRATEEAKRALLQARDALDTALSIIAEHERDVLSRRGVAVARRRGVINDH